MSSRNREVRTGLIERTNRRCQGIGLQGTLVLCCAHSVAQRGAPIFSRSTSATPLPLGRPGLLLCAVGGGSHFSRRSSSLPIPGPQIPAPVAHHPNLVSQPAENEQTLQDRSFHSGGDAARFPPTWCRGTCLWLVSSRLKARSRFQVKRPALCPSAQAKSLAHLSSLVTYTSAALIARRLSPQEDAWRHPMA